METTDLKISIIGAGNMGGAIARGLSKGTIVQAGNIRVSDVSADHLQALQTFAPEISISRTNAEIIKDADIIILAVKPWLVETVAKEIEHKIDYKKQIIVSIAAGVDFEKLSELFDTEASIFRVIPNTAIDILESVTTIAAQKATKEQQDLVLTLFAEM